MKVVVLTESELRQAVSIDRESVAAIEEALSNQSPEIFEEVKKFAELGADKNIIWAKVFLIDILSRIDVSVEQVKPLLPILTYQFQVLPPSGDWYDQYVILTQYAPETPGIAKKLRLRNAIKRPVKSAVRKLQRRLVVEPKPISAESRQVLWSYFHDDNELLRSLGYDFFSAPDHGPGGK